MKNRKHPEYCLLGIVLNYPEHWQELKDAGNIFQNALCYKIYEILESVEKFNAQTIRDIVVTGNIHEDEFENVYRADYEVRHFNTYLEHVAINYAKHKYLASAMQIKQNKYKSILELQHDFRRILNELEKVGTSEIITSREIINEMKKTNFKTEKYIRSHIPWIDEQGGYELTDLILIVARPSIGKTTLALNLTLRQLMNEMKAGWISLEVAPKKIVKILIGMQAEINEIRIKMNKISQGEGIRLMEAADKLCNENLMLHKSKSSHIEKIKKSIIKMIKDGAQIIYLDYIQKVKGGQGKTRAEQIGYVSSELKAIALEYEVPIVALAQFNRNLEKEGRKPRLDDIKDSGDIEQDGDIIMFLTIDSILEKTKVNMGVDFAKFRNGHTGKNNAVFEKSLRRIVFCKE